MKQNQLRLGELVLPCSAHREEAEQKIRANMVQQEAVAAVLQSQRSSN
jgi:predicted glycosyltransferase